MGTGWAAGGAPGGRRRLGEVLVAGQVLTEAQLDEALRVQRESAVGDLPVLVMSTTDDRPTRARAAAAGATAFIPKPFGEAELRSGVAALLQRQPALIEHPA